MRFPGTLDVRIDDIDISEHQRSLEVVMTDFILALPGPHCGEIAPLAATEGLERVAGKDRSPCFADQQQATYGGLLSAVLDFDFGHRPVG